MSERLPLRPLTAEERLYAADQSCQIGGQTGLVGIHYGTVTEHGITMAQWKDSRRDLHTAEFDDAFCDLCDGLKEPVFRSVEDMRATCAATPDSRFGPGKEVCGFRADLGKYAFILRLVPEGWEQNMSIFCYIGQWLDEHIALAKRGIRFIDPNYRELFRIPDGDSIRVTLFTGEQRDCVCRYVDDTHLEVTGKVTELFHICEFAERMERNGNTVIPLRSSLPKECYSTLPDTGEPVIIKKGEAGYYLPAGKMDSREKNREMVDEYNRKLGVSRAQEAAMLRGSMFGWAVPAADPGNYDEQGNPARACRYRGDAR